VLAVAVRSWRERHGLNQRQLAEAVGTSQKTITFIENKKQSIGLDLLERIAHQLDARPSALLEEDEDLLFLMNAWSQLTPAARQQILRIARSRS
jgi:transcriptional regulator with XRE-family HTH domain